MILDHVRDIRLACGATHRANVFRLQNEIFREVSFLPDAPAARGVELPASGTEY